MILFTFYWSYIFPSFFWRTSIKEDTHIWLIKYAAKLCLLAAWWEIVYSLLKTYWRKRLSCIIMLPRSLLLHACMHGLVVMCTLCTYSTIFQACPTCVQRTCGCVCVVVYNVRRRLFSFPRIDALDLFNDLLTRVVFWFGSFFHISVLKS